jgi:hypothetical protein
MHSELQTLRKPVKVQGLIGSTQGNIDYLASLWDKWKLGLDFSLSFIDDTGLMNVTSPSDWLRFGMGGHNIEVRATTTQGHAFSLTQYTGKLHPLYVFPRYKFLESAATTRLRMPFEQSKALYPNL